MGCIQKGRQTIIKVEKQNDKNLCDKIKELAVTQSSPTCKNKKRSTLKELSRLAYMSKDIKIKNLVTLIDSKPEDNYKIICKLGKGSFGSVFKVKHKITGEVRAMKIIKNTSVDDKFEADNVKFLKEIQVLKELDHPNIIKIFEYYVDNKNHYIITELLTGGELYESIIKCHRFNEKKAAFIMKQILSALNYLHSKGIVHRDIKPENILVQNNDKKKNKTDEIYIKLIDFGASIFFKENEILKLKVGSPYYIAPEVLNKNYNEKCDIWSAGVVLYVMLIGKFPFVGQTSQKLFESIKTGKYKTEGKEWEAISIEAKELIGKMLEIDKDKRLSASECLKSEFLSILDKKKEMPDLLPSVFTNIYKLNAREKIQQATIGIIVHNIQQNEYIEKLRDIFDLLDIGASDYVDDLLNLIDKNKDGYISFEEFCHLMNKVSG